MCTYFKTETDVVENLIDGFFSNFDIAMSDFMWKEYGGREVFSGLYFLWRRVVVVITTVQLHSTKPELMFCAGWNPTGGVLEIRDGDYLWQHGAIIRTGITCNKIPL